jgi:GAF domain-containing protein
MDDDSTTAPPLCAVCQSITGASGAGVMLMFDEIVAGSVCCSNSVSAQIEELQFTLGEGPCIDAYRRDEPVSEPDLSGSLRWVGFGPAAVEAGAAAVFGFPVRTGSARLGALNLYNDRPGPLSEDQYRDALVLADVAAQIILAMQAGMPRGELAAELERGSDLHYVVHQAAGMVSIQLDVSVTHALIRLRAHAYGNERSVLDVSADVVARKLRFDADEDHRPT